MPKQSISDFLKPSFNTTYRRVSTYDPMKDFKIQKTPKR